MPVYFTPLYRNEKPFEFRVSRRVRYVVVITFLCFLYVGPASATNNQYGPHIPARIPDVHATPIKPIVLSGPIAHKSGGGPR